MTADFPVTRVLIFGCNGQVGSQLIRAFSQKKNFRIYSASRQDVDLADQNNIAQYIANIAPDWVINAAAYTAVDQAESDAEMAFSINAKAPETMAVACSKLNAKLIHYSTDYVFDGKSRRPYIESDAINPINVYGESKAIGEQNIFNTMSDALVLRTSWVYTKVGKNFVNTMLRLAQQHTELQIVDDQHGAPTLADDLADVTANIVAGVSCGEMNFEGGIFHATGQQQTTWKDFCQQILRLSNFPHIKVSGKRTADYPTPATRPLYSVLSNEKLAAKYQQELSPWLTALERCLGADTT